MTDMVERVAKAIATQNPDGLDYTWEEWRDSDRASFRDQARAAIAAMRDPTEAVPTRFGIAVEQIYVGDVVVIEDGAVRRARQEDGPLTEIPLPPALFNRKIVIEKE